MKVNNSNSVSRMFQGKLKDFENKEEAHFFQRMLRAYTKGSLIFYYGRDEKGELVPYVVPQKIGTYEELDSIKKKMEEIKQQKKEESNEQV